MEVGRRGKFIGVYVCIAAFFIAGAIMLRLEAQKKPKDREFGILLTGGILMGLSLTMLIWIIVCVYSV